MSEEAEAREQELSNVKKKHEASVTSLALLKVSLPQSSTCPHTESGEHAAVDWQISAT
jgi:hypothetical protein